VLFFRASYWNSSLKQALGVHGRKREQASHIQAFLRDCRQDPILVEIVNVTEMNCIHRLRGISWLYDNRLGESA